MQKKVLDKCFLIFPAILISISVAVSNSYSEEYRNGKLGLELNYPKVDLSDSSTDEKDCNENDQCLLVFKEKDNPNVTFTIMIRHGQFQNICNCENLLEFVQYEYNEKFDSMNDFLLINDNQTTLTGNIPAMQMEYELQRSGDNSRHLVIWTTVNNIFYTISYHNLDNKDYSNKLPIFKEFLNSINFFEPREDIQPIQTTEPEDKKKPSFMSTDANKEINIQNKSETDISTSVIDDNTNDTTQSQTLRSSETSNTNNKEQKTVENEIEKLDEETPSNQILNKPRFDDSNFNEYYTSTYSNAFQDVNITGKIFNVVPSSSIEKAFQIYHLGNNDRDVYVGYSSDNPDINEVFEKDECIRISGKTGESIQFTNAFGAYRSSPSIFAENIQKIDCLDMVSPNAKIIPMEHIIEKGGIKVTLHKVEFDDENTRVFLTIENTNDDEDDIVRFYDTSNAKAFQGKKQYETKYSSSYPDISSSIPPGIEESGVVVFEPLQSDVNTKFQFEMSRGFLDDYKFVFNTNTIGESGISIDEQSQNDKVKSNKKESKDKDDKDSDDDEDEEKGNEDDEDDKDTQETALMKIFGNGQ